MLEIQWYLLIHEAAREAFNNNAKNPTSQKGMSLDMCNSEWARGPIAMITFMRESIHSAPQENGKAAKPVCDYLSSSCARLKTNSATRVAMIGQRSTTYCNKYWMEPFICTLDMRKDNVVYKWILNPISKSGLTNDSCELLFLRIADVSWQQVFLPMA